MVQIVQLNLSKLFSLEHPCYLSFERFQITIRTQGTRNVDDERFVMFDSLSPVLV